MSQTSTSQTYNLTTSKKSRLDEEVVFCWPRWCRSVAKWIFTFLLALLVLCVAVINKMALVAVAHPKSEPTNAGPLNGTKAKASGDQDHVDEFKFLALVFILLVPYGVEFVRCLWLHGFVRGHPWPSNISIGLGIIVSLVEVFGVCYFTIAVFTIPELSSTELILFTNAIFILPALKNFLNPRQRRSFLNILALMTVLLDISGLAWGIYKFSTTKATTALPASIVLISIAWFSPLRQWLTQPRRYSVERNYIPSVINDASQSSSTDRLTEFDNVLSQFAYGGRATLKSGILNSGLKLIAVPLVSMFFCHFYYISNLHGVSISDFGPSMGPFWNYMWVNVLCSLAVYLLGYLACSMGLQREAFAAPLLLVTPVCLFLSSAHWACQSTTIRSLCGEVTDSDHYHVLIIAAFFWIGALFYVVLYIWKPQQAKMASERDLFLIPYSYSGVFLEQYLFLNREDTFVHPSDITVHPYNKAKAFLCTTMYREDPDLLKQYLQCLSRMYGCQRKYTSIETHIVFDDAFTAKHSLNEHAQTFVDLCKDILNGTDGSFPQAVKMPYGSEIVITLEDGVQVYVHFKDSSKVKKGKRWSQLMIMSWIIDTKKESINGLDNTYFFTCDADVAFTYSSIEGLLDSMIRKPYVGGATCRIHAEGSGPVVWYQVFEYAMWHWLVKAANSVIGSLLCCTGCFSVFRLQALSEALPDFSRPTRNGADYIRRDLGEDRWLSCLLLQNGWLLDYCSLAEVSTMCPESFDDFFQQRRHWIASSFANTCALIKGFRKLRHYNNRLSVFYVIYLVATVFFMIVSPAVMIWMITGTLYYIAGSSIILQAIGFPFLGIMLIYMAACLFTLPDFHRAFAKGVSYILSIVVFVLALVAFIDVIRHPKKTLGSDDPTYNLDKEMTISVSLLYLIIYAGVFIITALVHPKESHCCLQSLWYLMCLPAFNIFLVTYTVCNINKKDSELKSPDDNVGWYLRFLKYLWGKKKPKSPHSVTSYWCSCCSNATDATLSEAIDIDQPETSDKCEGVEDSDLPSDEEDDASGELMEQEIVDIGTSEQRQYWKQLQEAVLVPYDEVELSDRQRQLCHIRNGALLVFSIANILWFIVDYGAVLSSPLGFASLTLFTAIVIIQFVAMLYHRLMTVAYELSRATFFPTVPEQRRPLQELPSFPEGW